jgi:putative ABC transport system substrate-binding protein
MRRRDFLTLLGGTAAAWPFAARAQQPEMPVIGILGTASLTNDAWAPFIEGLKETGYVEGKNVVIQKRSAENRYDRLPALAADLVRRQADVIVAIPLASALAAKAATTTIPIVFRIADDPVSIGLVASLNRPGGNITGLTTLNVDMGPKRLELLHELVPAANIVAVLVNPTNPNAEAQSRAFLMAAASLGLTVHVLNASNEPDVDAAFASLVKLHAGALVIGTDGFLVGHREQLGALSVRYSIPTIFQYRDFAAAGGLMSYGNIISETYRLVGDYTGRILKGEKPADLPVQQATRIELVINLKTAKELGLTIPLTLLGRADEVIE